MKVYVSKYALTQGIIEIEVSNEEAEGDCVFFSEGQVYFHCKEWHKTYQEACDRAEYMRLRKILLLEKQLKKYKNMGKLN